MKTTYSPESVTAFLGGLENALPESIVQLTEGHISQAFGFETQQGDRLVLRIADKQADFLADKYAADIFGEDLLIPRVLDLNMFGDGAYYCVTERMPGKTTNVLDGDELQTALPSIRQALANIYSYDVSATHGYGPLDLETGNAAHDTWHSAISQTIESAGLKSFRGNAANIGINPALVDQLFEQFRLNLPFASEARRLFHGDPAFDNMLVNNADVTAVIDWAQMGYGDWISDFARLDFWWPGRYGDIKSFADQYGLETDSLDKRIALYWATNALWTIEFADTARSPKITSWLHEHLNEKIV